MKNGDSQGMTPGDMERAEQDKLIHSRLAQIDRKFLVMSGKGGVGKSTVAAYLALLLCNQGNSVGLLDVDLHGPSIPVLFNIQGGLKILEDEGVQPYRFSDCLAIVSIGMFMGDQNTAVIWRGPLKISAIRQFISDIDWGNLDYLIIDSPPGTGDEPLTVAQTIPDAEAIIVTTPQEISLADVRKSITFCRQVDMKILGVIENMSGFSCPHCKKHISLFGKDGGARMASQMGVPLLGQIPIDPDLVIMADKGRLARFVEKPSEEVDRAYKQVVEKLINGDTA
jgi:Mrp family chromosome partitioning ATPase